MKRIAVIANNIEYANYLIVNLESFFGDFVQFKSYDTKEVEKYEFLTEEYIVLSAFTIFQKVKPKIKIESELVICGLTLNKDKIKALNSIEPGSRVLLVNIDYRTCMDIITMLYAAGIRDIEFVPYYKDVEYDKSISIAVTPGEFTLVPSHIKRVIDIGQRYIDYSSILELSEKLNIKTLITTKKAENYKKSILMNNAAMEFALGENESIKNRMKVLLQLVKQGVLITDVLGRIYLVNDAAKSILRKRTNRISGFKISEVLPEVDSFIGIKSEDNSGELINVSGTNFIVSISKVKQGDKIIGRIFILESFIDSENRQHKVRSKIIGKGHEARYTFDDILGNSKALIETKNIAIRMSKSNSSVIIYGESGVGKELFAQSIHNASKRQRYNFVAINCSALPEMLLESELYGYEDGAFSGAKKGGKIGLFELAHKGTLFLDEIGELPLLLQAKLLRVIEERQILRVGGMDMIHVDVRIITATNRDLHEMVEKKEFRRDLYYRLNVLPVYVPSLKERKEDIIMLFNSFCKKLGKMIELSPLAKQKMLEYEWLGNIRELKNSAEYLVNLDKLIIEDYHLPYKNIKKNIVKHNEEGNISREEEKIVQRFILNEGMRHELYNFILSEMYNYHLSGKSIGRRKLLEISEDTGCSFTEQELRGGISKLNNYGFIISFNGRKGSVINPLGVRLKSELGKLGD